MKGIIEKNFKLVSIPTLVAWKLVVEQLIIKLMIEICCVHFSWPFPLPWSQSTLSLHQELMRSLAAWVGSAATSPSRINCAKGEFLFAVLVLLLDPCLLSDRITDLQKGQVQGRLLSSLVIVSNYFFFRERRRYFAFRCLRPWQPLESKTLCGPQSVMSCARDQPSHSDARLYNAEALA